MVIGAAIVAVVGVIAVVVALLARRRLAAVRGTTTVDCGAVDSVAADGEAAPCEVVGHAEAGEQPLVAPLSGSPCVWYRTSVSRRYHERHGSGSNSGRRTRTRVVSQQDSPAPFTIRDGSGAVTILPEAATVIGSSKSVDRFEPYLPGQRLGGEGSLAERAVGMGLSLLTRNDHDTIGYEYREWIIREGAELYVRAGAIRDHTGGARLQKPASGPFLISTRNKATLIRRSRLTMLIAAGVGVTAMVAAAVLAVVALA